MATSFVRFKQSGFWVDDRLLRIWLYFLVGEVRKLPQVPRWLREAAGDWQQQSRWGATGGVSASLDEYVTTSARKEILVAVSDAAQRSVQAQGDPLHQENCWLIARAYPIPARDVRQVAFQFIKLLTGRVTTLASSPEAHANVWTAEIDLRDRFWVEDSRQTPLTLQQIVERLATEAEVISIPGHSPYPQLHSVFSFTEYKSYIAEATEAWWRTGQAYRGYHPEWSEEDAALYGKELAGLKPLLDQYVPCLPVYLLARCPLCGGRVSERVDTFSFNGFGWNNKRMEPSGRGWLGAEQLEDLFHHPRVSYHSECDHAQLMLYGVNLNGCEKLEGLGWNSIFIGSERPYVIPPLLQLADTVAVLHHLPLGHLADSRFTPRYTVYFTTYFTRDVPTFTQALEPYREKHKYEPSRISPYDVADYDLSPWAKAGRLFWLDDTDPNLGLAGLVDRTLSERPVKQQAFPYAQIEGRTGRWGIFKSSRGEYRLQQMKTFSRGWAGY